MTQIAEKLAQVRRRVALAAARAGRDPAAVRLVAVSKTHPADSVAEAAADAQTIFGESRVQEAREKIPSCPPGLEWHFIGHLQKNKVRQALPLFHLFHSVDTEALARTMDRVSAETGTETAVLLEVNVSGEATKHGFTPDALRTLFPALAALARLRLRGLMTMAPYSENPESARPFFRALRELRDELSAAHGLPLPELSMGMSGDFEQAVEEGATLVRVGTFIFGERPPAPENP